MPGLRRKSEGQAVQVIWGSCWFHVAVSLTRYIFLVIYYCGCTYVMIITVDL
jgi:hypothetical protein